MRILFLNPFFYPYQGGTEKHLLEVGKWLAKKYEVGILTAQIEGTKEEEIIEGIHVFREPAKIYYSLPHPFPPPAPVFKDHQKELKKYVNEYDIIHVHNRFIYGMNDAALVKKCGKKLALTLHNARPKNIDLITDISGGLYDDLIAKQFMYACDGIAAVSKDTLISTIPTAYKGKTAVIHNGVDSELFKPDRTDEWKEKLKITNKMVLTNARLLPQKGMRYLIDAMGKVPSATLVIFGRGPLKKQLEEQAEKKKIRVCFITEKISDEELAKLYNSADCFVLPSLYEPLGIVLLEAMACGLPIVTTNAGGNTELIEEKKGGFIVPIKNSNALAESINVLVTDENRAHNYGDYNRKQILAQYTWDHVAKDVERFYKAIL